MKTIEEKAKAYDEAIKKAKAFELPEYKNIMESVFPELKDSGDEKIRQDIIRVFKGEISFTSEQENAKYIAWLEKQGIQTTDKVEPKFKPGDTMRTWREAANGYTDGMPVVVSIDNEYYHCTNELIAIKDQDDYEFPPINVKKNPADNVEPKFKEGEWITNGDYTWKIVEVKPLDYILQSQDGNIVDDTISFVDEQFHSFTIEDAKDGDVLSINWYDGNDSWEKIIIFKKYHNKGVKGLYYLPCVEGYGNTFKNGKLAFQEEVPYYSKTWTANLHPATKEQRDLFFSKMKEEGWEWDSENKELIKNL